MTPKIFAKISSASFTPAFSPADENRLAPWHARNAVIDYIARRAETDLPDDSWVEHQEEDLLSCSGAGVGSAEPA
jgi:hypothetical protein